MRTGWLLAQLPEVMRKDPLLQLVIAAFEEVADTVLDRVDGVEHQVDLSVAPKEQLRYLASWLALALDPDDDQDAQRDLVRAVGRTLGMRGTRRALEELLSAATRSHVEVADGGGVFGLADQIPVADERVTVVVDDLGRLTREQVLAFCATEVPIGCVVDLQVLS
jgi:phage tail-like protein